MVPVIEDLISRDLMPDPAGLSIWDVGCGDGRFSAALVDLGAKQVFATDLQAIVPPALLAGGVIRFEQGDCARALEAFGEGGHVAVDLVFLHEVTEHVADLRGFFRSLTSCLARGTEATIHHGPYFQPVGHHDFNMLALNEETWVVEPVGVRCWESATCEESAEHRRAMFDTQPWQWSELSESTRDPTDCAGCNYYRRSQPWAHLLYGDDYSQTFPERWFRDDLNRLTTKQVRWFAQDAGLTVTHEVRSWVQNEIPYHLVSLYGAQEMSTFGYTLRARLE